jgi:hypothetical protein
MRRGTDRGARADQAEDGPAAHERRDVEAGSLVHDLVVGADEQPPLVGGTLGGVVGLGRCGGHGNLQVVVGTPGRDPLCHLHSAPTLGGHSTEPVVALWKLARPMALL